MFSITNLPSNVQYKLTFYIILHVFLAVIDIFHYVLYGLVLCGRTYGERVARHLDLDCSYVELVPKLYVNVPTEARLASLFIYISWPVDCYCSMLQGTVPSQSTHEANSALTLITTLSLTIQVRLHYLLMVMSLFVQKLAQHDVVGSHHTFD